MLERLETLNLYNPHRYPTCTSPFVSGDAFMSLASRIRTKQYSLDKDNTFGNHKKHITFVDQQGSSLLYDSSFLASISQVIYHNSDSPLSDELRYVLHEKKIPLFSVNIVPRYQSECVIPLGIENPSLRGVSPLSCYNIIKEPISLADKRNLVFLSIRESTNLTVRQTCLQQLKQIGIPNRIVSPTKYRSYLAVSKFTICPPGNGFDTHRFWEALYHRSIPVVLRRDYLFNMLDLPVLQLDEWNDLKGISSSDLDARYSETWDKPNPMQYVYFNYWSRRIYS